MLPVRRVAYAAWMWLALVTWLLLFPRIALGTSPAALYPQAPQAAEIRIRITDEGLSPVGVQLFGPTDVTWVNERGAPVILRSGDPVVPGNTLYLPTVRQAGPQTAQTPSLWPRVQAATVDFFVELAPGEIYTQRYTSPGSYRFHVANAPVAQGEIRISGTGLLVSSPLNGESGVASTRETIIAFSGPLDPATVIPAVFSAQAAGQDLAFRLHLSKDRRSVTLFYDDPLPGNARVVVTINGANLRDATGGLVDVDNDGAGGGVATIEFSTLSLAVVAGTSVCGSVFASELAANGATPVNVPLVGATITVDGREESLRTTTNGTGNFCLNPAPAGRFFVHIDGRTATNAVPAGAYYPYVGKAWDSTPGQQASVGDVYLPLVQPGTLQPVSQNQDVTIGFAPSVLQQFPQFADVAITVPAGSLFNDDGTPGGQVGIAPVPPDRIPGELPEGLDFALVITVQTDGATNFDVPAPVCFPNLPNPNTNVTLEPGAKSALWSFNHDTGRFAVVGPMTVTADGELVCTDPGVGVPAPGWHGSNPGTNGSGGPMPTGVGPTPLPTPVPTTTPEPCDDADKVCEQKQNYQPQVNGCGPDWLPDIVPIWNNPMFLVGSSCNLKPACDAHDVGYSTCGRPKSEIDSQFRQDMNAICEACYGNSINPLNLLRLEQCKGYATSFYTAVDTVGENFYQPAQEEACDCKCPSSNAAVSPPFRAYPLDVVAPASVAADEPALSTGLHYYAILNLDTNFVQRGIAGSNGVAFESDLILAPNTRYRIFLLSAATRHEGFVTLITPNPGESFSIPPISMAYNLGYDLDADGLGATGEYIMGTAQDKADSDGDGVLDGAEVAQGTNPLDNVQVQTGIIGTADTPGSAQDVCVLGDVAVVADGATGVAVFNIFAGMNPQIVAQVDTPGSGGAVACDGTRAAVADGSAGLAVVNLADITQAAVVHQVGLGANALGVTAANGVAYVGLSNGNVARVNLATGQVIGQLPVAPGTAVEDVALGGDYLYAATQGLLYAIALDNFSVVSSVAFQGDSGATAWRLRAATSPQTEIVYVTDENGYNTFGLPLLGWPETIQDNSSAQLGWKQLLPTGGSLGVAARGVNLTPDPAQDNVSLYTLSNPAVNTAFVAEFVTPGLATALALHQGLAYVADGDAGLQVLNFLAADTAGITPTVTLVSNFAPGRAEANRPMRLTALAQDDKLIRDVEFYVNGVLTATVGSFPFEYRFTTPNATFTVQAKATDTGGKMAWTTVQTRTIVADATPPRVTALSPARDSNAPPDATVVQATLQEPLAPGSLTGAAFQLIEAGPDDALGTADDVAVNGGTVGQAGGPNTVSLTFAAPLPEGSYRAVLTTALTDVAGNALPRGQQWEFIVAPQNVLEAADGMAGDQFGYAVALDGDLMAVTAPSADNGAVNTQGAVYLFRRQGDGTWQQIKKLRSSDGTEFDQFGQAVALDGDTLVVGAPRKRIDGKFQQGQVYVFERNAGGADNWGEVTRFSGEFANQADLFGAALAIRGTTLVVGSPMADNPGPYGHTYVYTRTAVGATTWNFVKLLEPSGGTINGQFGYTLAIRDDEQRIVVGSPSASDSNLNAEGAVLIYDRDEGGPHNWGQIVRLTASDIAFQDNFGWSVDMDGDRVVVGAIFRDSATPDVYSVGGVYVFVPDAGEPNGWREEAALPEAASEQPFRYLGGSVAVDGTWIVAGAHGYSANEDNQQGAVYLFAPNPSGPPAWVRDELWTLGNLAEDAYLGHSVAVDGATVVAGAYGSSSGRGAVYLYTLTPGQ